MGAARWVVVGTALVAAAVALHLLLSPTDGRRSVSRPERSTATEAVDASEASDAPVGTSGSGSSSGRPRPPSGPPQEELDAESRDAMRSFLRQSAQDEE